MRIAAVVALLAVALIGCGKKGPPRPPTGQLPPSAVTEIKFQVTGAQLELTWTAIGGSHKKDVDPAGFVVYQAKISEKTGCRECPLKFAKVADVPLKNKKALKKEGRIQMRYTETLKPGYAYAYKIAGYSASGVMGKMSKKIDITLPQQTPAPKNE
jgi:predicted small lipoprotein YifL